MSEFKTRRCHECGVGQVRPLATGGRVVPPRDPEALATAIGDMLADDARREQMGRRARALAEERFDVERMLDETATVLFGPGQASA